MRDRATGTGEPCQLSVHEDIRDLGGRAVRWLVSLVVGFAAAFLIVGILPVDAHAIGSAICLPMVAFGGFIIALTCAGVLGTIAKARHRRRPVLPRAVVHAVSRRVVMRAAREPLRPA
ncbi:MAG: hypothetical protein H0T79_22675 [Deltaproteobacteria bacterium]|nr:hypothetical protein [Deltaproteobacteria bacterium]